MQTQPGIHSESQVTNPGYRVGRKKNPKNQKTGLSGAYLESRHREGSPDNNILSPCTAQTPGLLNPATPIFLTGGKTAQDRRSLWAKISTYLENISTIADDLFLLTRESSLAVTLNDREVHCRRLNGAASILSTASEAPTE